VNPYDGQRLAARERHKKACWDVRTAELDYGRGSPEHADAIREQEKLQAEYQRVCKLHEKADCELYRLGGALRF
jgi:hypothetical protein